MRAPAVALVCALLTPVAPAAGALPVAAAAAHSGAAAQDPQPAPPVPEAAERIDFARQIAPIFVQRCIECHGEKLQKGDLRLDRRELALPADDETSWSVVPGKPDASELIRRLGLPLSDEEIMPNKGEPLSKPQQELLRRWVAEGAEWSAAGDEAIQHLLAAQVIPKLVFELPPRDEASQAAIAAAVAALQQKGVIVQRVAADTEALDVNFSLLREAVGDAELALLPPLAPVLVWLNLSRTGVTDRGLEALAGLRELRRLQASNLAAADRGFAALKALPKLEVLNAYGTSLSDATLLELAGCDKLQRLYVWQSKVTQAGRDALVARLPQVQVDLGDYVEERLAKAAQEIAEREARNKAINTVCPVLDKPADPAIHAEHDGRRVAFCCNKCKAAFLKEPAKYAEKLPPAENAPGKAPEKPADGSK